MASSINASTTAGVVTTADTSGVLNIQTAGTTAISIDASQAVTMAGRTSNPTTISVGGATPSTSGAGITFPATQSASTDANTLDDYEEGTWTATLTGSTAAPTVPVTSTTAIYTKIGRSVQLNLNFDNVSVVGATGDALVTGVPFAGGTVAGHGVVGINSFGSSVLFASIFNAVTQIALRNSITTVFAPITSGTTGIYITCGITYSV